MDIEINEEELLKYAEQEELFLFANADDYLAIANGVIELVNIKLRTKVASADVLVEALREITYSHDGYARKKAEQALATYNKLSEVKHDTK